MAGEAISGSSGLHDHRFVPRDEQQAHRRQQGPAGQLEHAQLPLGPVDKAQGYLSVRDLQGGITAWQTQGFPVVQAGGGPS